MSQSVVSPFRTERGMSCQGARSAFQEFMMLWLYLGRLVQTDAQTPDDFTSNFRTAYYRETDQHWFVYYSQGNRQGLQYDSAEQKCTIDGGRLAVVEDTNAGDTDRQIVASFLRSINDDNPSEQNMHYISAKPVWVNNPNAALNDYSYIMHSQTYGLDAIGTKTPEFPFLCEFDHICIDNPYLNPCQNGGICGQPSGTSYQCDCSRTAGFTGANCSMVLDKCLSMPCQNGVACTSTGDDSYDCSCAGTGYEGVHCELDEDECSEPAFCNSGLCRNLPGTFRCDCVGGYTGQKCERRPNAVMAEESTDEGGASSGGILTIIALLAIIAGVVTWVMYKRYKDRELILRGKKGITQDEVETTLSEAKLGEPKVGAATETESEDSDEEEREVKLRFNQKVEVLHMFEPRVMDQFKEAVEDPAPGEAGAAEEKK